MDIHIHGKPEHIAIYCWPYLWSFWRSSRSNRHKLQSSTTPLSFGARVHAPYISRN